MNGQRRMERMDIYSREVMVQQCFYLQQDSNIILMDMDYMDHKVLVAEFRIGVEQTRAIRGRVSLLLMH